MPDFKKRSPVRYLTLSAGFITGALLLVVFILTQQGPPKEPDTTQEKAVRYIEVQSLTAKMRVRGFGTVQSARPWQSVSNVSGRITEFNNKLKNGTFVGAGTHLLTIDPSRYQLNLEQTVADLQGVRAELDELEQEKENIQALYQLERERLALAEKELDRTQSLAKRDMVSENQVDIQKRATLQQRQATQSLRNQLNQIPIKVEKLEARQQQLAVRRVLAQKDLEDTQILAPFDLRIGTVKVQMGQQVNQTQLLFDAEGIQTAEIPVQIAFDHMRVLVASLGSDPVSMQGPIPSTQALGNIEARVYPTRDSQVFWPAKITRVAEGLNPVSRTLQIILSVQEPYRNAKPPVRPPLIPGSFVEAILSHTSNQPQLIIPLRALHQGQVYLVDNKNRLKRQSVKISRPQGNWVLVHSGLKEGDRVIIDDPIPAIEGMPLDPSHAKDEAEKLARQVKEYQL